MRNGAGSRGAEAVSALAPSSFPSAPPRFRFRALKGRGWQSPGAEPGETRDTRRPQNRLCCAGEALPGARWCLVVRGGSGSCPAWAAFRRRAAPSSPRCSQPQEFRNSLSPRGFFTPRDPPPCAGIVSLGAPSPASPSCPLGTEKAEFVPSACEAAVPTARGSDLILQKTPQETFCVDAVAGPWVPLDVRPGGGCSLAQGVPFPSSSDGFSPPLLDFILEPVEDGFRSWNAGNPTLLLWVFIFFIF